MGNWLRRSKSARYALEDEHSSSQSHSQGRPNKKPSKKGYHVLHPGEKIARHTELRLAPSKTQQKVLKRDNVRLVLKNFRVRWKCFYFGSFMNVRYRNEQ
jgi:hypothetical protein